FPMTDLDCILFFSEILNSSLHSPSIVPIQRKSYIICQPTTHFATVRLPIKPTRGS
ncbi:hypothetical protein L9F63_000013, partial [Diploptera punctata]